MMKVWEQVLQELQRQAGKNVSGEELAGSLGVSRNAVWKAVKKLQAQGYSIDAGTNRGYCLQNNSDVLTAERIRSYLPDEYKGVAIEFHSLIDSTNRRAKDLAAEGHPEGLVVVAEEQSAGRGRRGRSFFSPGKSGVYVSFLFRPTFSVSESLYLTTAAAVAAAEAIEASTGVTAQIKWVNDVFCHQKKVCGILTEASVNMESGLLDYAVTGIGFNLREPQGGFPEEIRTVAGSIYEKGQTPGADVRSRLIAGMIERFFGYYRTLTERSYMEEYRRRSFLIGQRVYTLQEPVLTGTAVDVDDEGHLILELDNGERRVLSSGEVSVRPLEMKE